MALITCGHCGATHSSVAEVRACTGTLPRRRRAGAASRSLRRRPAVADPAPLPARPAAAHVTPSPVALEPDWSRLAGPGVLGRSVVVGPGPGRPATVVAASNGSRSRVADPGGDALGPAAARLDGPLAGRVGAARRPPGGRPALAGRRLAARARPRDRRRAPPPPRARQRRRRPRPGPSDLRAGHRRRRRRRHAGGRRRRGRLPRLGDLVRRRPARPDARGSRAWPSCPWSTSPWSLQPLRVAEPAADLAADQREAVRHRGGGARIIAPAGSGKTRVLTERARHLVRDVGVDAGAVCLVAFNVRARQEMQERTTDLAGLQVRTLNSLGLAILQGSGPFARPAGRRPPEVIEERAVRRLLGGLVTTRRQALSDPFAAVDRGAVGVPAGPARPQRRRAGLRRRRRRLGSVLAAYRSALADGGMVDFDEQIVGAVEVLLADRDAREAARRACGVLLVDEFQDLTPAHVLLVRLLGGPRRRGLRGRRRRPDDLRLHRGVARLADRLRHAVPRCRPPRPAGQLPVPARGGDRGRARSWATTGAASPRRSPPRPVRLAVPAPPRRSSSRSPAIPPGRSSTACPRCWPVASSRRPSPSSPASTPRCWRR